MTVKKASQTLAHHVLPARGGVQHEGDYCGKCVEQILALQEVVDAAKRYIDFEKANSGPYYVPHGHMCADSRHEHTGSRYDLKGTYLGGWKADHECPPCDCGAKALLDAIAALRADGQPS